MDNFPNLKKPSHFLVTFFGVGLLPLAPGTWGSLAGLLLFFAFIYLQLSFNTFLIFLVCIVIGSIFFCSLATSDLEEKDHKAIVIDEVAGVWTTFMFIPALGIYNFSNQQWNENSYLAAVILFLLFRLFDILKPHPISFVDKRFKSGLGVVLDDLMAGVFAGLTLLGGNFFINIF